MHANFNKRVIDLQTLEINGTTVQYKNKDKHLLWLWILN